MLLRVITRTIFETTNLKKIFFETPENVTATEYRLLSSVKNFRGYKPNRTMFVKKL